jgi:hypothetical protein
VLACTFRPSTVEPICESGQGQRLLPLCYPLRQFGCLYCSDDFFRCANHTGFVNNFQSGLRICDGLRLDSSCSRFISSVTLSMNCYFHDTATCLSASGVMLLVKSEVLRPVNGFPVSLVVVTPPTTTTSLP